MTSAFVAADSELRDAWAPPTAEPPVDVRGFTEGATAFADAAGAGALVGLTEDEATFMTGGMGRVKPWFTGKADVCDGGISVAEGRTVGITAGSK